MELGCGDIFCSFAHLRRLVLEGEAVVCSTNINPQLIRQTASSILFLRFYQEDSEEMEKAHIRWSSTSEPGCKAQGKVFFSEHSYDGRLSVASQHTIELSRSTFHLSAFVPTPHPPSAKNNKQKPLHRFIDRHPTGPVTSFSTQNPLDRISCRERIHRVEMETR